MNDQFKEAEKAFDGLKKKFRQKEISRGEFINELKKLKFKDEEGRFWMIGSQTGKWYYFDGKDWIQSEPPSIQEGKAICIYCGFENTLKSVLCARCGQTLMDKAYFCKKCGYELDQPDQDCPNCGKRTKDMVGEITENKEEYFTREEDLIEKAEAGKRENSIGREEDSVEEAEEDKERSLVRRESEAPAREKEKEKDEVVHRKIEEMVKGERTTNFVFRSLSPLSFLLFWGITGLLAGIIVGAFTGATDYFYEIGQAMPSFLLAFQGKLIGGIIYAVIGGLVGFIGLGVIGYCLAYLVNFVLSLIGGVKVRIEKS
jgi:hypothetical protein